MNYLRSLITSLAFLISSCNGEDKNESTATSESTLGIATVNLTELNGTAIDPKQFTGKAVFINYWATWCKPCLLEMPSIEKAQSILANEKLVFLLASNETVDNIEEFSKSHEYEFKYVRIENMEDLHIDALPTTFIFSPEGKLVFSETGFRNWDDKKNIDLLKNIINQQ